MRTSCLIPLSKFWIFWMCNTASCKSAILLLFCKSQIRTFLRCVSSLIEKPKNFHQIREGTKHYFKKNVGPFSFLLWQNHIKFCYMFVQLNYSFGTLNFNILSRVSDPDPDPYPDPDPDSLEMLVPDLYPDPQLCLSCAYVGLWVAR